MPAVTSPTIAERGHRIADVAAQLRTLIAEQQAATTALASRITDALVADHGFTAVQVPLTPGSLDALEKGGVEVSLLPLPTGKVRIDVSIPPPVSRNMLAASDQDQWSLCSCGGVDFIDLKGSRYVPEDDPDAAITFILDRFQEAVAIGQRKA